MNEQQTSRAHVLWQAGSGKNLFFSSGRMPSLLMLIILLAWGMFVPIALAQSNADRVNQVKAAFILNIVRFVAWPEATGEHASKPLSLCLYRDHSFNHALARIQGKKVGGRSVQVSAIVALTESDFCHVLLIPKGSLDHFENEIQPGLNRPMLTIADFTDNGSAQDKHSDVLVALVRKGAHIGFQVNLKKSREVGLWMSSKLLKLATIVGEDEE